MYLRIVRAQPQAGQVDELARRWQEFWTQAFPGVAGFRHAYFAGDRDAGATVAVSIFESRPDPAQLDALVQEFRASIQDIAGSPPVFEDYEVLSEV